MNDQDVRAAFKSFSDRLEVTESMLLAQQKQIGRLIQCIGELDLSKEQRYYLHKAIWGEDLWGDDDE